MSAAARSSPWSSPLRPSFTKSAAHRPSPSRGGAHAPLLSSSGAPHVVVALRLLLPPPLAIARRRPQLIAGYEAHQPTHRIALFSSMPASAAGTPPFAAGDNRPCHLCSWVTARWTPLNSTVRSGEVLKWISEEPPRVDQAKKEVQMSINDIANSEQSPQTEVWLSSNQSIDTFAACNQMKVAILHKELSYSASTPLANSCSSKKAFVVRR